MIYFHNNIINNWDWADKQFLHLYIKTFKVSKVALRHRIEYLYAQADITGFTFHDLRHTFASRFVMNGGTLEALKPIMGHSSMDLTLRYAHLSPAHIQKQITVLNSLF